MNHTFTLVLASPRTSNASLEDAVFEAGCDDAALGVRGDTVYLEFDRGAATLLEATMSAIRDVQRIPGVRVAHVEPDELVTGADIARRTGRSRESVRLLAEGSRGPGGFPRPLSGASGRRIRLWRWSEVVEWIERHDLETHAPAGARAIAAVNGALALTRNADPGARAAILEAVAPPAPSSSDSVLPTAHDLSRVEARAR
jgi:hypothetical protein